MGLHLRNIAITRMGPAAMSRVHARFETYGGVRVMAVRCDPSPAPVYVRGPDEAVEFYIRAGASSSSLSVRDSHEYIVTRFRGPGARRNSRSRAHLHTRHHVAA